jgi:hypothetical protein
LRQVGWVNVNACMVHAMQSSVLPPASSFLYAADGSCDIWFGTQYQATIRGGNVGMNATTIPLTVLRGITTGTISIMLRCRNNAIAGVTRNPAGVLAVVWADTPSGSITHAVTGRNWLVQVVPVPGEHSGVIVCSSARYSKDCQIT